MPKVELSYNPYLRNTEITFNGKPPGINSLVERYQNSVLQDWLDRLPQIFHDEMNGFDFELEFTGTELDFEALQQSFLAHGISSKQVRLFHKNVIDSRELKRNQIAALYGWIEANPNALLDKNSLLVSLKEIARRDIGCLIVSNQLPVEIETDDHPLVKRLSIETILDISVLRKEKLSNTPIVLYLDATTVQFLPKNIKEINQRQDLSDRQIFFWIASSLDKGRIIRIIEDYGIEQPQLVNGLSDKAILNYINLYPVTQGIYDAIEQIRPNIENIQNILKENALLNDAESTDVQSEIDDINSTTRQLTSTKNDFIQRNNLKYPSAFNANYEWIYDSIINWKNNWLDNAFMQYGRAAQVAQELNAVAHSYYDDFLTEINRITQSTADEILNNCRSHFDKAGYGSYCSEPIFELPSPQPLPDYSAYLLTRKVTETYEVYLVKAEFDRSSYSLEDWRTYLGEEVCKVAAASMNNCYTSLNSYYVILAENYISHISQLVQELTEKKQSLLSQSSEKTRQLQADKDWGSELANLLTAIERD